MSASKLFAYNLTIFGFGGVIAPFIGIKAIDLILAGFNAYLRRYDHESLKKANVAIRSIIYNHRTCLSLAVTLVSESVFPSQAHGSLIMDSNNTNYWLKTHRSNLLHLSISEQAFI